METGSRLVAYCDHHHFHRSWVQIPQRTNFVMLLCAWTWSDILFNSYSLIILCHNYLCPSCLNKMDVQRMLKVMKSQATIGFPWLLCSSRPITCPGACMHRLHNGPACNMRQYSQRAHSKRWPRFHWATMYSMSLHQWYQTSTPPTTTPWLIYQHPSTIQNNHY